MCVCVRARACVRVCVQFCNKQYDNPDNTLYQSTQLYMHSIWPVESQILLRMTQDNFHSNTAVMMAGCNV